MSYIPRLTSLNGLPLANIILSPTMENASSGVHSAVEEEKPEKAKQDWFKGCKVVHNFFGTIKKGVRRNPYHFLWG